MKQQEETNEIPMSQHCSNRASCDRIDWKRKVYNFFFVCFFFLFFLFVRLPFLLRQILRSNLLVTVVSLKEVSETKKKKKFIFVAINIRFWFVFIICSFISLLFSLLSHWFHFISFLYIIILIYYLIIILIYYLIRFISFLLSHSFYYWFDSLFAHSFVNLMLTFVTLFCCCRYLAKRKHPSPKRFSRIRL